MKPTIGIIGCGKWGNRVARKLHELGHPPLVAYDLDPEAAKHTTSMGYTKSTTDTTRYDHLDLVIIATPSGTQRAQYLHQFKGSNTRIRLEKPATTTPAESEAITQLPINQVSIGQQTIFDTAWCTIREAIQQGGGAKRVTTTRITTGNTHDSTPMQDLAVHDLANITTHIAHIETATIVTPTHLTATTTGPTVHTHVRHEPDPAKHQRKTVIRLQDNQTITWNETTRTLHTHTTPTTFAPCDTLAIELRHWINNSQNPLWAHHIPIYVATLANGGT